MGKTAERESWLPSPKIAPSMLSSDFANLASEAKFMLESGADWLHMDVMVKWCSIWKFLACHYVPAVIEPIGFAAAGWVSGGSRIKLCALRAGHFTPSFATEKNCSCVSSIVSLF